MDAKLIEAANKQFSDTEPGVHLTAGSTWEGRTEGIGLPTTLALAVT